MGLCCHRFHHDLNMATKAESRHMMRVKELPCGLCGAAPPSSAHHVLEYNRRVSHFLTIPLCWEDHQGLNGIHGDKTAWHIRKVSELDVLAETIGKLNE
jgi:hypothetical protein